MKPTGTTRPTGDPLRFAVAAALKSCDFKGILARDERLRHVQRPAVTAERA